MSAISITASSVTAGSASGMKSVKATTTITAGQLVYQKADNTGWALAQSDGTADEAGVTAQLLGVAMSGALAGNWFSVLTGGSYTAGGTLVAGVTYYLSPTAGGFGLYADLSSTNYAIPVGVATTTALLTFAPTLTGTQVA